MKQNHGFAKMKKEGGEIKMKNAVVVIAIAALVLGIAPATFAATQSLSVRAQITSGVSLPTPAVLRCPGTMSTTANPWTTCSISSSGVDFGTLTNVLANGRGAGCLYASDFFIVYLYPNAWGGVGYDITQTFTWSNAGTGSALNKALVLTPYYSNLDEFDLNGDNDTDDPGEDPQGARPSGSTLGAQTLGAGGSSKAIYKSEKPGSARIVRAQYGLPPYRDPNNANDTRPSGWEPVPESLGANTYTGNLVITIAPY